MSLILIQCLFISLYKISHFPLNTNLEINKYFIQNLISLIIGKVKKKMGYFPLNNILDINKYFIKTWNEKGGKLNSRKTDLLG